MYLSDIGGGILFRVNLGAEGAPPPAAFYHGVHGRGDLLIAGVGARTAGLLLVLDLLGLLLVRRKDARV